MTFKNKQKDKTVIAAILAVAMISLSAYSYAAYATSQTDSTVKTNLWGKVNNDNIVGEERVIKVNDARDKLEKTTDAEFAKNGLPINMIFTDPVDKTLVVGIKAGSPLPLATYKEKLQSFVGTVPMKVSFVDAVFNTYSCTARNVNCTPQVGGIEIDGNSPVGIQASTFTLGATNTSNTPGFIIAGHATQVGATGYDIYQIYTSPTNNRHVGKVLTSSQPQSDGKRLSDSAFVKCDTDFFGQCNPSVDAAKIYRGNNVWYNVQGKRDPVYQDSVSVSGAVSNYREGFIIGTNLSFQIGGSSGPWYKGQAIANYILQGGDSGAPVFTHPDVNNNVTFLGIHSAFVCIGASGQTATECTANGGTPASMLSPWSSIKSDLSLN